MTPREAFADQAVSCRALGSELTARVLERLGEALTQGQGPVAARILNWQGDVSSRGDSVPLRLAGALHALVRSGADPELARAYAEGDPSAALLLAVIARHPQHIMAWLDSPPQTNEVARSAVLIGMARFLGGLISMPLEVLELGASAGLNLNFHRYRLAPDRGAAPDPGIFGTDDVVLKPEWRGEVPVGPFEVVAAGGVDLRPVDPVADGERLLAYCWADQAARMERLQAALRIARAQVPEVSAGDAAAWLAQRLERAAPGRCRVVYHTVAWQYFPDATQAACEASLQTAGRAAGPHAPLAHFSMEADGGHGAALHLRVWNGELRRFSLGRADFHGRWVEWKPVPV